MKSYATISILLLFLFISFLFISLLPHSNPEHKMTSQLNSYPTDPYKRLNIIPNPDGSITRLTEFFPTVPPSLNNSISLSKDVPLNPDKQTWVRLYLPNRSEYPTKLPIIVFVHGGGFILCSAAAPFYQEFCTEASSQLGALIVSVEYRLAPEHRLPAPYDDVLEALTWVKDQKDEWVRHHGDLLRCYMMGESAGGNIVFHAGLRAAAKVDDLKPLVINGLVLIQPYFGGPERTGSELRLVDDSVLALNVNELMWALALPVGADRSHEYCDPTADGGSKLLDRVRDLGWKVGVVASDGDPLFDRDVGLVKLMGTRGVKVKSMIEKGEQHGVFVSDSTHRRKDLLDFVRDFLT